MRGRVISPCAVSPRVRRKLLAAVLLAVSAGLLLLALVRHAPEECALERLSRCRGWTFEELINFTDARVVVAGNVSLLTNELLTSITVWRGASAESYLVYSNATTTLVFLEGGWIEGGRGWRLEDTVLYRALRLAAGSPGKRTLKGGGAEVVEFEGPCLEDCRSLYSQLRGLALSSAGEPVRYRGRLVTRGCAPEELVLVFEDGGPLASLTYRVKSFDVPAVVAKP